MASLITNSYYKSFSMISASGLLSPTFGLARRFSQVPSGTDLRFCQHCQKQIRISTTEYRKALLGRNLYEDIPVLARECKVIKDDTFSSIYECLIYQEIYTNSSDILLNSPPVNLERFDAKSADFFLSAFSKFKGLAKNESDLTGDGGKLALEMLTSHQLMSKFGCVVDIGGQDSQFVQNFPDAQQKVVDKNTVAVLLDEILSVKYAIGSADIIFSDSSYMPEETRPCTLFAMSCFINVLSPSDAWKILGVIIKRMNKGDLLVITNLDKAQLIEKKSCSPDKVNIDVGIVPFYKIKDGKRYKSTIDSKFKNILIEKFPDLRLQDEKRNSLMCKYLKGDELMKKEVKFITVMFELIK